ncbi:MAG: hypothetical protein M5U26_20260 [Planctomycetota bacterium]|nr:hypothetical protein [Planctomycetota bacterium]
MGVARTHSLLVGWYVGDFNEQRTRQWVGVLNRPPVVQPDPQWIVHVDARVMMPTLAKGEMGPDYEAVESGISAFLESLLLPRDAFPYTGWYEWGKHPDLRYEKANTLVFAQWWRLNNLNYYYYSWNLSHLWMRTGERKFLQELEKVNNFLADNSMIHWDGGSSHKLRGYLLHGSRPFAPIYWDSTKNVLNEGGSTESITGFAYEYFLRDNRNYLDIFFEHDQGLCKRFQE